MSELRAALYYALFLRAQSSLSDAIEAGRPFRKPCGVGLTLTHAELRKAEDTFKEEGRQNISVANASCEWGSACAYLSDHGRERARKLGEKLYAAGSDPCWEYTPPPPIPEAS